MAGSILIKDGLLVDTEWVRHEDILIEGEKIKRIAPSIDENDVPEGTSIISADGKCVLPGLIDAHTHYHLVSRGTVTADSFLEGSKLASYGGVTTVIDFADDDKKSLSSSLSKRLDEMKDMAIDYALHQGVYKWRPDILSELEEVKKMGVGTIKIFTTYKDVGDLIEDKSQLEEVFKDSSDLNLMVSVHAEDDDVIRRAGEEYSGNYGPESHPVLRPSEAEAVAIRKVGDIAKKYSMPLYIVHLSSRKGLMEVRKLRSEGVRVIVETTPHYLFLDKSYLSGENGPLYVMTPPLRSKDDSEALREALSNGEIQVVATDHCAFTRAQKLESNDVRKIYPGIPGTEEMLPLLHTFALSNGHLSLSQIVNLLSTGPAKAFGLYPRKGVLREGSDADVVIFDPDESWTLSSETVHSASGYTPYEGFNVTGKVQMTILRGRIVMGDDIYLGIKGDGKFIEATR